MALDPGQQVNSYTEEHEAIQTRFGANFDSALIPVQYGNHGLLKFGNETVNDPDDCEQFVRFNIIGGPGTEPEITRTFTRVFGVISIGIFSKRNTGTRKNRMVADMIYPIFSRVSFHGIVTEAPTVVDAAFNEGWYQTNMTIPYRWERCLT